MIGTSTMKSMAAMLKNYVTFSIFIEIKFLAQLQVINDSPNIFLLTLLECTSVPCITCLDLLHLKPVLEQPQKLNVNKYTFMTQLYIAVYKVVP